MGAENLHFTNFYERLGVKRDAKPRIIQQVYLSKIRETFPDFCLGQSIVHDDETRDLEEAFKTLSDKELRAAYDELLHAPVFSDDAIDELPKLEAPHGYVYVVQEASDQTRYKIGKTVHPARRLRELTIGPFDFTVVAILKSASALALEGQLHLRFANKRTRGEWFELSVKDLLEIRSDPGSISPLVGRLGLSNSLSGPIAGVERQLSELYVDFDEVFSGTWRIVRIDGRALRADIPPGVYDRQEVEFKFVDPPSATNAAGTRYNAAVRVGKHRHFARAIDDLIVSLWIDGDVAKNGGTVRIATLRDTVALQIPADSRTGDTLTVQGYGMPIQTRQGQFGDLYVTLQVDEASVSSAAQRLVGRLEADDKQNNKRRDQSTGVYSLRGLYADSLSTAMSASLPQNFSESQCGADVKAEVDISLRDAYTGVEKPVGVLGNTVTVVIPPGVASGDIIRISGKGRAGKHGGSAGNLLVTVTVSEDPRFVRMGAITNHSRS